MIVDPVYLGGSSAPGALPPSFRPIAAEPAPLPIFQSGSLDAAVASAADELKRLSAANEEVWCREPTDHADERPVHVAWEYEATAASDALTSSIEQLTEMPVATAAGAAAIADAVPSLHAFLETCGGWPEMALIRKLAGDVVRVGREAPAGADDHILTMVATYWRLRRIELAAGEEDNRLCEVFKTQQPVPPPEIRRDAIEQFAKLTPAYYSSDKTEVGSHISKQGADWLRANPRTREAMVTWSDRRHTFERVKDDAAEAKVQAMLVVYDQWCEQCFEVAQRCGSWPAQLAYDAAGDAVWDVLHDLYNAWPTTLLGFAAMASVMVDRDHTEDAFYVLAQRLAVQATHLRPADVESGLTSIDTGPAVISETVREVA